MEHQEIKRSFVPQMEALLGKVFPVHNEGFVKVVDYLGSDEAIVQMARTSYGQGTKTVNEDRGLIRYLMRNAHTSPFEGAVVKLHLKMPIFVARQWVRHRTASMNEYSARYSEVHDSFFVPKIEDVQLQSKLNKQGSAGALDFEDQVGFVELTSDTAVGAYQDYLSSLKKGVAREMARVNLPLTAYTEMYWQMNLHNLLHFCKLRSDPHAQKEIRAYSDVILKEIIKVWTPLTYEAFMDFVACGAKFSRQELEILRSQIDVDALERPIMDLSEREWNEFKNKLRKQE